MSDEKDHDEWVEVRRYNDPLEADMARDFLEQSGVKVLVRGNSGVTGVLNRFDTILDIRLTVPAADLVTAREALEAMQAPKQTESPFRGIGKEKEIRDGQDEDGDAPIPRKKSPFLAMGFALMLPIGAGHAYAGHQAAGNVLGLYIVGMSLAAVYFSHSPQLWVGVFALIAIDVLFSPFAVNRFNRGAVTAEKKQLAAAGLVGIAVVALTVFMS